jgi:hypothetical protein
MSQTGRPSETDEPTERTNALGDKLPASTKALGLTEILQLILLQVPLNNLTALRRVARLWKDVILAINHVDPWIFGHGDENCTCLGVDTCVHMPHYASRFAITGNPVFTYTHIYRCATRDRNGHWTIANTMRHYRGLSLKSCYGDGDEDSILDTVADHFITDPPITIVALSDYNLHVRAMMRVSTGIRVCDIQDAFAKIYNTDSSENKSIAQSIAWYGASL